MRAAPPADAAPAGPRPRPAGPAVRAEPGRRRASRLLWALLALAAPLAASSCGGEGAGADGGEGAGSDGPDPGGSATAGSASASDSAGRGRPTRAFRFLLRNPGEETAVVVADAGAGGVVLDTVPAADSATVRVETRAARIELRARTRRRDTAARVRYDLERPAADTLLEFGVPPGTPADTTGG